MKKYLVEYKDDGELAIFDKWDVEQERHNCRIDGVPMDVRILREATEEDLKKYR